MNIVVPMAGLGSRFLDAGYLDPKPLIKINNKPMIEIVIDNLKPSTKHKFIFICQKSHELGYQISNILRKCSSDCELVFIDGVTDGAACTVLEAKEFIDNEEKLMIANCDQFIDIKIDDYLMSWSQSRLSGYIMTMKANDTKWSYVGINQKGLVNKVVEKQVISEEATVGIYNFKSGKDFVSASKEMIEKNERVNNEFYVAPVYNYLFEKNYPTGFYNIGSAGKGMYGLGTPSDLDFFLSKAHQFS